MRFGLIVEGHGQYMFEDLGVHEVQLCKVAKILPQEAHGRESISMPRVTQSDVALSKLDQSETCRACPETNTIRPFVTCWICRSYSPASCS